MTTIVLLVGMLFTAAMISTVVSEGMEEAIETAEEAARGWCKYCGGGYGCNNRRCFRCPGCYGK